MIHEATDHIYGGNMSLSMRCSIPVLLGELCIAAGVHPIVYGGFGLSRGPTYQVLGLKPTPMDGPQATKQKMQYMFTVSSNHHDTTLLQSFNTLAAILSTIHTPISPPCIACTPAHQTHHNTLSRANKYNCNKNSLIFVDHMIP